MAVLPCGDFSVFASVLMSVYERESASHLSAALNSLLRQTRPADEIVLVKDGPLPKVLEETIDEFQVKLGDRLKVLSLEFNGGLPAALNAGLELAQGDVVVRMDSDDVCHPERLAQQLNYLEQHPEVDVLGSAMYEFSQSPEDSERIKPVVSDHQGIVKQMVFRNPINHPTVCFRTKSVAGVGGYPDLRYVEDYLLWVNLAAAGAHLHNLDQPLVYQRFDLDTIRRRGGWLNFRNEITVRRIIYQSRLSGPLRTLTAMLMQVVLRLLPAALRLKLWHMSRKEHHG